MNFSLIITLSVYIVLILSLVVGFLLGLKRGLVKSSIRLGVFILCMIIAGFITKPISNALLSMNISKFGIVVEGKVASTLSEALKGSFLANEKVLDAVNSMPSVMKLIDSLPTVILDIVVFFILVLFTSLFSWIIYFIIAKTTLKQSKLEKQAKKQKKLAKKSSKGQLIKPELQQILVPKQNKHKWWGSCVGLVNGFIFIFLLLLPITSITSTFSDIAKQDSVSAESEVLTATSSDLIRYYVGDEIISYVNAYSNSVAGKILTIGGLDDVIFDSVTSLKVNNQKVSIRADIKNVANIYDNVVYLIDEVGTLDSYSKIDFKKVDAIVDAVFNIGTFRAVAVDALPYALNYLYETEMFKNLDHSAEIKFVANAVVDEIKKDPDGFVDALKTQFGGVIEVGKSACRVGLVDDIVGGKRDYKTIVASLSKNNYELLNSITSNLLSKSATKVLVTEGGNVALEILEKKLGEDVNLGRLDKSNVDWSKFNSTFSDEAKVLLNAFDIINKYDADKVFADFSILVSEEFSTADFEKLVDCISKTAGYLQTNPLFVGQSINSFNALVDYAQTHETLKNFVDAGVIESSNLETEIQFLKPPIIALKHSGILHHAIKEELDVDYVASKLQQKIGENQTTKVILVPVLDSKLTQKSIKFGLEKFNELVPSIRELIGKEVVEIDLTNFTYLSAQDKIQTVRSAECLVDTICALGYKNFKENAFETVFTFNDKDINDVVKASYIANALNNIKLISLTEKTYNSIFDALSKNESFNKLMSPEVAKQPIFSWDKELELLNILLSIAEKEQDGESIKSTLYPAGYKEIVINNTLVSKVFKHALLPLVDTKPEETSLNTLVTTLYQSQLFKKALPYILNIINERISKVISSLTHVVEISKIELEQITDDQKSDIINILETLARSFDVMTKESFDLETLTDDEIVLVGNYLNALKENAYDYADGKPNPNCKLADDGKTIENGGIFAELYVAMIDYAKESYEVSPTISYGEIEWINFLKTAKKLSEISDGKGDILDIISDTDSDVNVGEALEVIGVEKETADKVNNVKDSFANTDSSSAESYENLADSLGNITDEDATNIIETVKNSTGKDISGAVNTATLSNEQTVSSRISVLMTTGLNDANLDESLADLCNGATYVLAHAVSSGVVITNSITGGNEALSNAIDAKTTNTEVKALVKSLFAIN